ncbi:phosphoglycerate dehydrogenase [Enterococcus sp. 669A]|uniref:Phosphoglycerate dehydrogenase n=1 Tax=Candidatus Enterococcus moelleringii TaxID=2815325 RepID=A0ABS3LGD7_9ENTE|nr:phosphoglycerate dehydrogenase [Enterococcus sp. 669A]MBO1308706.1 phosphoglycerate dehydrogenase [Enterococcus sp. 669A]
MQKPIIYLQRPFREEFIAKIKEIAPDYQVNTELSDEELANVEITVGWKKEKELALLNHSNLKWVQAVSAGVDYLPLSEFEKHDILLSNGSGIHAVSISEHIIGTLLAYYRGLNQSTKNQMAKKWDQAGIHYDQLSGKNLLVVGTGHIGKQLSASLESLGVNVYGINTTGRPVDGFIETYSIKNLSKIVEGMDIVVGILPGTEATYHIFNSDIFNHMKASAMFVNVGRGDTVHTKELATALKDQQLAFAALDVFEEEPLPVDSQLWDLENLLITPHISGMTVDFQLKFMNIFLKNLKNYVEDGELVENQVRLKRGY